VFSVCALTYGDHPKLIERLLRSLRSSGAAPFLQDLRIGFNAVSPQTRELVFEQLGNQWLETPCYVYEPEQGDNVGKYPLMRRMFYDPVRPLADRVMWFDDDSHLDESAGPAWWRQTVRFAAETLIGGAIHKLQQRRRQYLGIPQQPWYSGMPLGPEHTFRFVTGGWWVGRTEFLTRWDYPFPEVFHNGGDSILGELVRQQSGLLKRYPLLRCHCESCQRHRTARSDVVHINVGGRKGRRGLGKRNEVYPWQNYPARNYPEQVSDTSHQQFSVRVHRFQ
jgi:hypothetical protein